MTNPIIDHIDEYKPILRVLSGHDNVLSQSAHWFTWIESVNRLELILLKGKLLSEYQTLWYNKKLFKGHFLALVGISNRLSLYKASISHTYCAN